MIAIIKYNIILCLVVTFSTRLPAQEHKKKLIEFGWNYPDVSQLKNNLNEMQRLPFDGVVFSLQRKITDIFDTIPLNDSYFEYETLPGLQWKRFTDNFIYLWGMSNTGGHWLSDADWKVIVANTEKISKAVKLSNAKGVLFDPEFYYENPDADPWKYRPELYNGLSYQAVSNIVKKRGAQFIQALESHKPDVKVLSIWLFGLIIEQLKTKPPEKIDQALLLPFIDGMLTAKGKNSVIIDGNETAYWYTTAADFSESGEMLRRKSRELLPNTPKVADLQVAQCLYYDGIFDLLPERFKKYSKPEAQKKWFTKNLYNALASTDEYVWLYSENINWWKPMQDSTPIKLVENVLTKFRKDTRED